MDKLLVRTCLLAGLLTFAASERCHAQSTAHPPVDGARIALRIADLTPAERDALSREFADNGHARIVFACVPAGLIILEATDETRSTESLRLHAMPDLLRRVSPTRITEDHLTLQGAEDLCAVERDR